MMVSHLKKICALLSLLGVGFSLKGQIDYARAQQFREQGNEDSCLHYAERLVRQSPTFIHLISYAKWLADFGHLSQAMGQVALLSMSQISPTEHIELVMVNSSILTRMGKEKQALALLERELREYSNSVPLLNHHGHLLCSLGEYDKALSRFEEAQRLDPKNAYALYFKGKCLHSLGHLQAAAVAFRQCIDLESGHDIVFLSPFAMFYLGLKAEAIEVLHRKVTHSGYEGGINLVALLALAGEQDLCHYWLDRLWYRVDFSDLIYFSRSADFKLVRHQRWFKEKLKRLRRGDLRPPATTGPEPPLPSH